MHYVYERDSFVPLVQATRIGALRLASTTDVKALMAGNDGKYAPAAARIEGETVIVEAVPGARPLRVRYGWKDNPDCNLFNSDGLPASPFQSKDWQGATGE